MLYTTFSTSIVLKILLSTVVFSSLKICSFEPCFFKSISNSFNDSHINCIALSDLNLFLSPTCSGVNIKIGKILSYCFIAKLRPLLSTIRKSRLYINKVYRVIYI